MEGRSLEQQACTTEKMLYATITSDGTREDGKIGTIMHYSTVTTQYSRQPHPVPKPAPSEMIEAEEAKQSKAEQRISRSHQQCARARVLSQHQWT